MVDDQKGAPKTGRPKKLQDGVALTNGMIRPGEVLIEITTSDPGLTVAGDWGMAKEMVE